MSAWRPEPFRRPAAALAIAAAILSLASPSGAWAGAQKREPLSAAVRTTLSKAVSDPDGAYRRDPAARGWVRELLGRVNERMGDQDRARELLEVVRYEARRAGLEPRLVLAVIDVESGFRKYAVSGAGARGYMQVMPFWVKDIGEPGQNLFHLRTNVRYGCVILRHYLRLEDGNLYNALGRYNGTLGKPGYPERVLGALHRRWSPGT